MKCKAIERLILENEERELAGDEKRLVESHLRECARCRAFEAGRHTIREGLKDVWREELPLALDLRTRHLCLEALGGRAAAGRAKIPVPVIAVSILFAVLAAIWLTAALSDVAPGEPLPSGAWVAIVFIAQNALVLFFSPIILRAARPSKNETSSSPGGF
jgi:anti-sigma factor RsiW